MAKTFPQYGVDYAPFPNAHPKDVRPFALFNGLTDAKRFRDMLNEDDDGMRYVVVEFLTQSTYELPRTRILP